MCVDAVKVIAVAVADRSLRARVFEGDVAAHARSRGESGATHLLMVEVFKCQVFFLQVVNDDIVLQLPESSGGYRQGNRIELLFRRKNDFVVVYDYERHPTHGGTDKRRARLRHVRSALGCQRGKGTNDGRDGVQERTVQFCRCEPANAGQAVE